MIGAFPAGIEDRSRVRPEVVPHARDIGYLDGHSHDSVTTGSQEICHWASARLGRKQHQPARACNDSPAASGELREIYTWAGGKPESFTLRL